MLAVTAAEMLAAGKRDPRYYAQTRPALAESEATRRAIDYAALTGAETYIVHVSCRGALEAIRFAPMSRPETSFHESTPRSTAAPVGSACSARPTT